MVVSNTSVPRVGFDLDNTLIDYQPAIRDLALSFGLGANSFTQASVRSALRRRDGGEDLWQEFQSYLYTDGLRQALPAEGSVELLQALNDRGFEVCIVSHKTKRTQERFGARDLRAPARDWLHMHRLVPGLIAERDVFFEEDQAAKVTRIRELCCDFFIDDLEEIVNHPDLIGHVRMIQFQPAPNTSCKTGEQQVVNFEKIRSWLIPN